MDKKILICAAIIFILALLAILAWNNLEIYQGKRIILPSDEVSGNIYYAMDQWLMQTGHNVRIENFFNPYLLADTTEKIIMISSRTYSWYSTEEIIKWIERGGCFILCLEPTNNILNQNLLEFLLRFGIIAEYTPPVYGIWDDEAQETNRQTNDEVNRGENNYPDFYTHISFTITEKENVFTMKDADGNIRLVEIPFRDGLLIVTGIPLFMYNYNIGKEANSVLTWNLTGARLSGDPNSYLQNTEENSKGILFFRNKNVNRTFSIFGPIIESGNIVPVIVSALILIFAGFWMVIPSFGKILNEKKQMSRPIKDRLTAEIRFLKKYRALDYYLESLPRETSPEVPRNDNRTYNDKDLINLYRSKLNGTSKH